MCHMQELFKSSFLGRPQYMLKITPGANIKSKPLNIDVRNINFSLFSLKR